MKMTVESLVRHLRKFVNGENMSINWAKDAETLLDELEDEGVSANVEAILDRLQDNLAIYSPGGGDHLIGENEMKEACRRARLSIEGIS
jgi:hypothetical protein